MNKQELAQKIKKMEAGLDNPNIADQVKDSLNASIKKAKEQLATMEEKQKSITPEAKRITKKDFYADADKAYPDLTHNGLNELTQQAYDVVYRQLVQLAESKNLTKKEARDYVDTYLARHIPAGTKLAKPKKQPKPKKEEDKPSFSWKAKVDLKTLQPVVLYCQHYSLPVKKETLVRLKASGNESMTVTAQAGEHLIFDDQGYLVFVMNKGSFARKCNEGTTIDAHEKSKHLVDKAKSLATDLQTEQEKAQKLKEKVGQMENQMKQLEAKKEVKTPPKKADTKTPAKAQKPVKRSVCTLGEAETGRRVGKVTKFFLDEAEAWNSSKSTRKITKIMQTKGDKQDVIIEVADYRGFATGLATLIGGSRKYYRLCIDSFKLTSVDKPKLGSYKIVVSANKMKEVYTTKGAKQYAICLKSYRELLKCSFEGSCTKDQEAKWKTLYRECGDLVAKLEKNPEVLRNFHVEVKKRRKVGEKYSDAMGRVAREIKI